MLKKVGICKWVYFSIYPFYGELYILLITVFLVDGKTKYNNFQNKFNFKTRIIIYFYPYFDKKQFQGGTYHEINGTYVFLLIFENQYNKIIYQST